MIPSPFHGIFSSTRGANPQHDDDGEDVRTEAVEPAKTSSAVRTGGQVALDIFEQDDYYILKAPLAGVRMSDIDIEVDGKVLTIRGVRRQTDDIPPSQYYLTECFWGEFSRSVTLPTAIDPRKVKATFNKESILKILVPKEERVKIIRIND